MRLVDSSAWIEWLAGSPLEGEIVPQLPDRADWLVPTVVQFELVKWARRIAPATQRDEEIVAFTRTCVVVPLTTAIAVVAVDCALDHRLATADAIIYATAQQFEADLLTCDAHFEGLPGVIYVPKKAQ